MSEQEQPVFSIEKLYLKDLSLEIPNAPQIFLEREAPQIDVQLNTKQGVVSEGIYETSLTVTITAKLQEKTMFLIEATQGGIFRINNVPAEEMDPILGIACPNILFPYVREVVSDAVTRAGFPPVILNPMNFEGLYQQQKQAQQDQAAAAGTTH
ncbi:protein-export chaperone SecB [Sulfurirhabdus autotrophica]|uniref:Protein-export protein SecB n=1 Tax=Sulfurirhabdus autotrophica TaxID=1706046 RepID=A0A4R3XZJ0_9PROT|nr:protein-export chaperone SecB [Sulfurirhabdus autotrophica]TCV85205.1 protein translocase subunit secB [Sulfurirhabdus autotrophica]